MQDDIAVTEKENKRSKKKLIIILIALLLVFAICAGTLLWVYLRKGDDVSQYKNESSSVPSRTESEPCYAENPIDFDTLISQTPDVCAWIKVPNTKIDYPVLQSSKESDDFYIDHSINGRHNIDGAIYIQRLNSRFFTDRNTVIYGHNLRNGTMFRTLHNFRNKDFFDQNEYFYIYLPGHILTYRIFAAYRYDNRHILNSFDFSDTEVYAEYLKFVSDPVSVIKNVRPVELTTDDKIVTLSTCISDPRYRYLVQGVQISDELTY